jgi:hypothetical protein
VIRQARRSASLRAAAARSADARMEGPNMLSRDLVPMAEGCASRVGAYKPQGIAAPGEPNPKRRRRYSALRRASQVLATVDFTPRLLG